MKIDRLVSIINSWGLDHKNIRQPLISLCTLIVLRKSVKCLEHYYSRTKKHGHSDTTNLFFLANLLLIFFWINY